APRRSRDGLAADAVGDPLQLFRAICSRRLGDFRHRDLLRACHPSATSLREMRIFLAGATGVIGIRLLPLLVDAGHVVAGMTRSPDKVDAIRARGSEPVVCDVFEEAQLADAV